MSVSDNVVILTREEFETLKNEWFEKGVQRGRFEQRYDDSLQRERASKEYQGAGLVLLARHPAPKGDGTTVGVQPAGQPIDEEVGP